MPVIQQYTDSGIGALYSIYWVVIYQHLGTKLPAASATSLLNHRDRLPRKHNGISEWSLLVIFGAFHSHTIEQNTARVHAVVPVSDRRKHKAFCFVTLMPPTFATNSFPISVLESCQ